MLLLMLGIGKGLIAQDISRIEYFFDNDPGFGNGTEITGYTSPTADLINFPTTVDASGLADGIHTLFVRTKNTSNNWSVSARQLFLKQSVPSLGDITRLEYFFDNDPGHGNGIEITGYTAGTDIVNFATNLDASNLNQGIHTLFVRSKDDWSITARQVFLKQNLPSLGNNTRLEYFFDNDPGHGNGTEITGYAAGTDIVNFNTSLDASSLAQGIHTLFVRSKEDWSITARQVFLKQNLPSLGNITRLEYFFDNDPGHGNGTEITGYTAGTDIVNFATNLDAGNLNQGIHTLFVRSKDDWSITARQVFLKQNIESLANITALEYFFDNDPGAGNGTQISISPSTDIIDLATSIDFTALANGQHYFFIRSKNVDGEWSITQAKLINKDVQNPLPLSWLSFDVKEVNKTAVLNWQTASEINTQGFEIQRSSNANIFEKIGELNSNNNKPETNNYQFIDQNMSIGLSYYRIKQLDLDGKFSYSPIRQVINESISNLTIEYNGSPEPILVNQMESGLLQLFNSNGELSAQYNLKLGEKLILEKHLNAGLYLAILSKNGKLITSKKVLIVK
jgi:hypothetical protein